MSRQENWVTELKKDVVIPESVKQKAHAGYNMIRQQAGSADAASATAKKYKPKWTAKKMAVLIAVAALACTTLTVGAVALARWNDNFAKRYDASKALQNKLAAEGVTKVVDEQQTVDGVTIKAVQAIADKGFAYVMFEITGDQEFPMEKGLMFGESMITGQAGERYSYSAGIAGEPGVNGELIYEAFIMDDDGAGLLGKELQFEFNDLVWEGAEDYADRLVHQGTWEFTVEMPKTDSTRSYELDQGVPERGVKIKKVELSPISVTLYYENREDMETDLLAEPADGVVTIPGYREALVSRGFAMKDGSTIYFNQLLGGSARDVSGTDCYASSRGFAQIVDVDEVESILFGKMSWLSDDDDESGEVSLQEREEMIEVKLQQ